MAETPKIEASIQASQNTTDAYVIHSSSINSSESHTVSSQAMINNSMERPLTTKTSNRDYFHDTLFIGDSRTQGLMTCSDLSDATFYAVKGLTVNTIFTEPAVKTSSGNKTIMDALKTNKFGKIYIMLGINELGWSYSDIFINKYGEIIDAIQKSQPSAKIIVQAIFPVTEKKSASDKIYNNANIAKYNMLIQKMAQEKNVIYLDVSPALTDSSGGLSPDATTDGIHLNPAYCQKWSDFLKANKK